MDECHDDATPRGARCRRAVGFGLLSRLWASLLTVKTPSLYEAEYGASAKVLALRWVSHT